jgi:hypothetical protein
MEFAARCAADRGDAGIGPQHLLYGVLLDARDPLGTQLSRRSRQQLAPLGFVPGRPNPVRLQLLDTLAASSRLARWPQLHIARAALLAQCGRHEDAVAAYRDALALEPAGAVRRHITGQIAALGAASAPTEET